MSGFRAFLNKIGKTGIVFLLALFAFVLFYWTGHGILTLLAFFVLLPAGAFISFRGARYIYHESLWSVRNRLLCVYTLFGVLPVLLLFLLFAITSWALVSELAIYLATSALNRRVDAIRSVIPTIRHVPARYRKQALPEIENPYRSDYRNIIAYVKDSEGAFTLPEDAPHLQIPAQWGNTGGLLVLNKKFYAWSHYSDDKEEITILASLSDDIIANLVPNLGIIALVENSSMGKEETVSTGAVHFDISEDADPQSSPFHETGHLPPPMGRLDIPVMLPSTVAHYHLDSPGRVHQSLLWVRSRPSAVMRAFFSDSDLFRGIFADVLISVAVLFLLVEMGAVFLGVSLSTRITRAVNQLYEGTRRVIRGDFTNRIPIASHDQLGELAASFNQMTSNLERLLLVEKERERLQAEIEIAREVQQQLYPQEEAPRCGLRLTARCDPARMVSGDYYDYQMIGRSKLAFAIGDVAGKGISAALLMATIQAALRAQVSHTLPATDNDNGLSPDVDSAALVTKLNRQVWEHTSPEKYATFFFSAYDSLSSILTYTNAGHLPPLLFRNGEVVPLDTNGTVVGAFPKSQYETSYIALERGDLLVCYTDGITEPENTYGEMFGEERLIELVQRHAKADDPEIIRLVFDAVRAWTGTPELQDDMTLMLARHVGS